MRPFCFLLVLFSLGISSVSGQIFDRSLGYAMGSYPQVLRPIDADHWMVASSEGTDYFLGENKIFLRSINLEGQVTAEYPMAPAVTPFGTSIADALPTPDGGFVAAYSTSLCDVVTLGPTLLTKINAAGETTWQIASNGNALPSRLAVAPDGTLLGVNLFPTNQVVKYDLANGAPLSSAAIAPQNPVDMAFIPGTEDLVVLCYTRVEWWHKTAG